MAVAPETNQAFVREVDDELRRDRTEQFFRRYGMLVIVAVGVFLAATGGWLWWQNQRQAAAGQQAEALDRALADVAGGPATEARGRAALDDLAKSSKDGYAVLARLTLAAAAMQKDDTKTAARIWSEIAADESVAQPFRDLALIRQTTAEFDTLPLGTVKARMQGLAVPGNPWFGSAGELVAVAMLKAGDRAGAAKLYDQLAKDERVPQTVRSRAVQMAGIMSVNAPAASAPAAAKNEAQGK
ncbi:tetratricopeptide repeat protein [Sphingomonas quercus]|uniref:Tetratricopeptide repeat protein n=1 Tax=Sphingomonas quercus TaxID=2842451 RepID=A0ABS6BLJ1_9SPHN|nr:tetratricopeptide repeat protein [Sphingomonas quercus]MBU3078702.1 tetratricopeptide repeat protein [Sphingomonas quercus]